jgi:hypothetical protein
MPRGYALTAEQISFLRFFGPTSTAKQLTLFFNTRFESQTGVRAIRSSCRTYGITVITEGDGRFKKGHETWNKEIKGLRPSENTEFKPGMPPANTDEIGVIKSVGGYFYKKINNHTKVQKNNNWKPVHHLVWQEHRGDIPKGHVIVFKDGDKTNCSINNLDCISRAKNMVYNRFLKEIRVFECYESKSVLADLILSNKQGGLNECFNINRSRCFFKNWRKNS